MSMGRNGVMMLTGKTEELGEKPKNSEKNLPQ
jgi:hypothetical protein